MKRHQLCSPSITYDLYPQISTSTEDEKKKDHSSQSSNSHKKSDVEMKEIPCKIQEGIETNKPSPLKNYNSESELSDSKSSNSADQYFHNAKHSRIPYSLSEDEEILKFVLKDNNIFRTSSISLWKLLERKKGDLPRTYQSLKNRFYRNIKPLILKKFRKFLTDELIKNILIKFPELKKDLHYIPSLQDSEKRIQSTSDILEDEKKIYPTDNKDFSDIKSDAIDDTSKEEQAASKVAENRADKIVENNNYASNSEQNISNRKTPENVNVPDLRTQVSETDSGDVPNTVNCSAKKLNSNTVNEEVSRPASVAVEVVKPVNNYTSNSPDVTINLKSTKANIFHEEKRSAYHFVLPINFKNLMNSNEHATINKTNKIPNIDLNIVLVNSDDNCQSCDSSESLLSKANLPLNININVMLNGFKYSNISNQISINDENEVLENLQENNCANQSEVQDPDGKSQKSVSKEKKNSLKRKRLVAKIESMPSDAFTFKKLESLSTVNKARLSALLTKLQDINQKKKTCTSPNESSKSRKICTSVSIKDTPSKTLENKEGDTNNTTIAKTVSQKDDDEESSSLESTNCSTDDDSSYSEILEDLRRTHKVGSQEKNSESEKGCNFRSLRKRNLRSDFDIEQKECKKKKLELDDSFALKDNTSLGNVAICSTPKKEKAPQKADKSSSQINASRGSGNKMERLCKELNNLRDLNNFKDLNYDAMDNVSFRETRSSARRKILDKL